jgi:prepilin-type N-terminal cleavage/methylation domain-containing protein
MKRARRATSSASGGFTLLEVMIALLLATIGLLGTVAVQMTMFNATANGNDAAVATRLCAQGMEELSARVVRLDVDQLAPAVTTTWTGAVYLDATGHPNATPTAAYRFKRETMVTNQGVGKPYNVSVRVTYSLDTGLAKTIRVDQQRRKTW